MLTVNFDLLNVISSGSVDLMLTVNFDLLNVISSGSVVMKIDANVCFPSGPSGGNTSDRVEIL
jgi:hypothetical protein